MNVENLEEEFRDLYNEMLRILEDINSVNQHCIDFNEEWKLIDAENLKVIVNDSSKEFENQKSKITRKAFQSIFLGETSAGKSTLVNAILGRSDLPEGSGNVTNSFVEIKKTSNNSSYFTINNESLQRGIGVLKDFIMFNSETCIPEGSHVDLFYTVQDCPFIRPSMTLIDIPGIDADTDIDEKILLHLRGANLIVLVVNSTITMSNCMKQFVNKVRTIFSNLNIIIVYNHLDQLDDEDDPETNFAQLSYDANLLFMNLMGVSVEYARSRTFFVSAKEVMTNRNTDNQEERIKEFVRFKELLISEMRVNSIKRRHRYLEELNTILGKILIESRDATNKINYEISIFCKNVFDQLKKIPNLEKDVVNKILNTMTPLYEEFQECALREVRRERDEETKMKRVEDAVSSVLDRGLGEIKEYIADKIKQNNEDCLRVIERWYFPEYLEKIFPIFETVQNERVNDLRGQKIKALKLAAGGVACAVAAAIAATPVGIPLALGSMFFNIFFGYSFKSVENDASSNSDQHEIRVLWNQLVNSTKQSFLNFLTEINTKLPASFAGEERLRELGEYESRMNSLRERLDNLNLFY